MQTGLSRTTALWLADHALPVAGVALLVAGQAGAGWLTPLGWGALGLAALAHRSPPLDMRSSTRESPQART